MLVQWSAEELYQPTPLAVWPLPLIPHPLVECISPDLPGEYISPAGTAIIEKVLVTIKKNNNLVNLCTHMTIHRSV